MRIEEHAVSFRNVLKEPAYCRFRGQDASERSHSFRVFHKGNGLSVTVGGDFPISYVAYYADPQAVSPEAFCAIRVEPGETFRWARTYHFAAEAR